MSQSSPFFNRWLSQLGPDRVIEILTDLVDAGAVFAVDADSKILFWSKGAERLFSQPAEAMLGKPCAEALGCAEGRDPCGLAELGTIRDQIVTLRKPDGDSLTLLRTARGFFNAQGQFVGALEFLQPRGNAEIATGGDGERRFHGILSRDPAMLAMIGIIRNVAETDATVLIRGESGTGKELVARALHLESPRRQQAFLAINCAALTPSLLESELFGHVKGAFTGAVRDHIGLFQRADGGTLFLDEVAELPLELQAKLLRVLQEKTFIPVGGNAAVSVDVRIVAATHRSLRDAVKSGRFREDLMYRLRVVPIFLPPLRERPQDIELLLNDSIDSHNRLGRRQIDVIDPEVLRRLLDYRWPGNVRELINVVEYAFAVGRDSILGPDDLPPEFREPTAAPAVEAIARTASAPAWAAIPDEAERIRRALQQCQGHQDQAAALLGISRATLWRKRKKFAI